MGRSGQSRGQKNIRENDLRRGLANYQHIIAAQTSELLQHYHTMYIQPYHDFFTQPFWKQWLVRLIGEMPATVIERAKAYNDIREKIESGEYLEDDEGPEPLEDWWDLGAMRRWAKEWVRRIVGGPYAPWEQERQPEAPEPPAPEPEGAEEGVDGHE